MKRKRNHEETVNTANSNIMDTYSKIVESQNSQFLEENQFLLKENMRLKKNNSVLYEMTKQLVEFIQNVGLTEELAQQSFHIQLIERLEKYSLTLPITKQKTKSDKLSDTPKPIIF